MKYLINFLLYKHTLTRLSANPNYLLSYASLSNMFRTKSQEITGSSWKEDKSIRSSVIDICYHIFLGLGNKAALHWWVPSLLYNGYRVFPGVKERPERDADPTAPSSAVAKKEYSYTSIPPMGHTACTEL